MKRKKTIPVLMAALALMTIGALASSARAEEPTVVSAQLGIPFVLVVGETGRVEPVGLEVTFRSISDDSGCFAPGDCSLLIFWGTLAMRLNDQRELVRTHSVRKPGESITHTFAGHEIRFDTIRRLDKDRVKATFTVVKLEEEKSD